MISPKEETQSYLQKITADYKLDSRSRGSIKIDNVQIDAVDKKKNGIVKMREKVLSD